MYLHHQAKLIYLATPRTASTATSAALLRVGFERPSPPADHHMSLKSKSSPITGEDRKQWTVFSTVRNPWDAAVSWASLKSSVTFDSPTPWSLDAFKIALDPKVNRWLQPRKMYWLHLKDCDLVMRYETLKEDLKHILTIAGIQMPFLGHYNVSMARRQRHYGEFYSAETRDYIGERFATEIRELGYSFDGRKESEIMGNGELEACKGCGAMAVEHPWVAVMKETPYSREEPFISVPVCDLCYRDKGRHKPRKLKAHYFSRDQAARAVAAAGSMNLGG